MGKYTAQHSTDTVNVDLDYFMKMRSFQLKSQPFVRAFHTMIASYFSNLSGSVQLQFPSKWSTTKSAFVLFASTTSGGLIVHFSSSLIYFRFASEIH